MLKKYLNQVINGENLSQQEAMEAMQVIMSSQATEAQIGAFLTALKVKGEVSEEISGFAQTLLKHADRVSHSKPVICPCGTGGDTKGTFNVSTTVAFVLAGGGVAVAKHGNRSVSSSCGSADVLSQLGVMIDQPATKVSEEIEHLDIGFLFAPALNQAMRVVANPRKELGFRTVFNLLGPIINPAYLDYQLVGIYDGSLTEKVAEVLKMVGVKQAMVVHSDDGMDEISTNCLTKVSEMRAGSVHTYYLNPQEYGFQSGTIADYHGGSPEENAQIVRAILNGDQGAKRDIVVLNAAAGFYITNKTKTIAEGIQLAKATIDSGAALAKLDALIAFSRVS